MLAHNFQCFSGKSINLKINHMEQQSWQAYQMNQQYLLTNRQQWWIFQQINRLILINIRLNIFLRITSQYYLKEKKSGRDYFSEEQIMFHKQLNKHKSRRCVYRIPYSLLKLRDNRAPISWIQSPHLCQTN